MDPPKRLCTTSTLKLNPIMIPNNQMGKQQTPFHEGLQILEQRCARFALLLFCHFFQEIRHPENILRVTPEVSLEDLPATLRQTLPHLQGEGIGNCMRGNHLFTADWRCGGVAESARKRNHEDCRRVGELKQIPRFGAKA